jgi:putative ABC transport system permease protein
LKLVKMVYWLLHRRLRYSWGLLALTSFGILAAVTLMSTGALYSRVLGEAGLRHSLASFSPQVLNTQIIAQNRPVAPSDYLPLLQTVEETSEFRIGNLLRNTERFGRMQTGFPASNRPSRSGNGPSGRPFFMTGFQDHARLSEGSWPGRSGSLSPQGVEIDTVIGVRTSRTLGLQVGSQVFIWPFQKASDDRITLNIVGMAEPNDSSEEFWMGNPAHFSVQVVGEQVEVPFYVTEDDFFGVLGTRFPTVVADFGFSLFIDSSLVTVATVDATQDALAGLETDLNKQYPRTLVLSRLSLTLDEFQQELTLARVPLYVFISLFVIVIMYFLVMITGILGRSQAEEAGLLRSRGASVLQVTGVLAVAEGIAAVIAVAIGPLLAWVIVRYLLLPTIDIAGAIAGGGEVPSGLSGDMFWMGAAGGGLAVVVLVASALGRARLAMVESLTSRARPPSVPFLHRYYIDILAVLAVGLIWWQVRGRDGFVAEELAERGVAVDPTLIMGPVLGLFAAAVLLMRVLPMGVSLLARAGARSKSAWLALPLVRLARDPIPHGSLAVMLMLAAALGVFGATFQSSLSNSQRQRALHAVGGDLVVRGPSLDADSAARVALVDGVQAVTPVLIDSVPLLDIDPGQSATLLAAEPTALAQAAWFRDDFAGRSLSELGNLLRPLQTGVRVTGVPLPENADRIGLWVNVSDAEDQGQVLNVNVWVRLVDRRGQYRNVSLGSISDSQEGTVIGSGWRFLEGELPVAIADAAHPLELVSIFLSSSSFTRVTAAKIHFDDVATFVGSSSGDGTVIEGFESPSNWQPLANRGLAPDSALVGQEGSRSGNLGLTFRWEEPFDGGQRGVHLPPGPLPIPAIGGPTFQPGQNVRIEHGRLAVPLQIVATTKYFPTVSTSRRPFLLVDLNDYEDYLALLPVSSLDPPDELWLALDPAADREQVKSQVIAQLPALQTVVDREQAADLAESNPLAGGGWDGLTALGMTAIGIAVVLTLGVYAAVSVRTGRTDLAVARALGFSRSQFLLSVSVERLLIAALAITAGAAIGYWPGLELIELMDLSPGGLPAVPPLVPAVQGWLLAVVLAGLSAASVASVLLTVVQARRLNTAATLREGG